MSVMIVDDTSLPFVGIGSIITPHLSLPHVYHIPNHTLNLVFVSQLCDSSYSIFLSFTSCFVQDPQSHKLIGIGCRRKGLYILDKLKVPTIIAFNLDLSSFHLNPSSSSFYLWHSRLIHVSTFSFKIFSLYRSIRKFANIRCFDCSSCKLTKFSTLPFNRIVSFSSIPFDLVHFNVWVPSLLSTK